jgi:hypothetical protein
VIGPRTGYVEPVSMLACTLRNRNSATSINESTARNTWGFVSTSG